jgi:hypothetical protein
MVAVLDPKKIPDVMQVVFGKHLHAIYFIVEEGETSNPSLEQGQDKDDPNPMDEDDDLLGDEEKELAKNQKLGGDATGSSSDHSTS